MIDIPHRFYERYTGAYHGSWMGIMNKGDKQQQSSERLITSKANRFRDMLSIAIENNTAPDIDVHKRTDKPDKFLHGFGLENIERTVEKYQGQCSVKQEAGVFALQINVPIP